jgi:hypothetical protein
MGVSVSKSASEQDADIYLTQQFSGTCDVSCQNALHDVNVDIINSTIGGSISLDQTCSTNASCIVGNNTSAIADVLYKASNSSNAKNAGGILQGLNVDVSTAESRQNIAEDINQQTSEHCNVTSYNEMDNISIFAANSTIGGDISISQNASTQGQCQLTNTMSAAAYASGIAQNVATSGKDKKGQKFGNKKGKKGRTITYVVIGIIVVVLVFVIAYFANKWLGKKKPGKPAFPPQPYRMSYKRPPRMFAPPPSTPEQWSPSSEESWYTPE